MNKFVIVDIETTGHSPKKGDRIIQFAGVVIENEKIVDIYTTYINPEIPISPFITELTGIDNEQVATAPLFHEVAEDIIQLLDGACFVAHNVHFDYTFLQEQLEINNFPLLNCPLLDTVEMTRIFMPTMESLKLNDIATFAGFDHDRPHQADSDAFVTAEWFLTLLQKINTFPKRTINQLRKYSKGLRTNLYEILDEIYEKKTETKEKFPEHLEIYRGIVYKKQKLIDNQSQQIIDGNQEYDLEDFINKDKLRAEQWNLVEYIYKCLSDGELSLVEADLTQKKELSYLLAATALSIIKQEPVVVSLATIGNQQMVVDEVLPQLKSILKVPIHVQLLKGKQQYLNLWKFERVLKDENQNYDEIITKMQMLVWLTETETGDVSEINLSSAGIQFLKKISDITIAEADRNNPWKNRDFYKNAINNAQHAQVILTNHHFLMANRSKVLPNVNMNYCIIDDAHLFEKNAEKYFGKRLSYSSLKFYLNQLGSPEQLKLVGKIEKLIKDKSIYTKESTLMIQNHLQDFSEKGEEFFQLCYHLLKTSKKHSEQGKISLQIEIHENDSLLYSWERFYDAYLNIHQAFYQRLLALLDNYQNMTDQEKLLVEDFAFLIKQLTQISDMQQEFTMEDVKNIIWLEADLKSPQSTIVLKSLPVDIHEQLADFYLSKKAVLFISHSLTIKNSFAYTSEQLGLDSFPYVSKQFQTNINKEVSVQLYAMNDIPNILEVSEEEFIEIISNHIIAIAQTVQGKLFITFSSYEMLKKAYNLIKDSELLDEFVLLAQGVSGGSVHRLAKQFNRFEKALFFSTTSHIGTLQLEGKIDAMIVVRLPFASPNEPVFANRLKVIKSKGKSPFYELSLPDAILRFKHSYIKYLKLNHIKGSFIVFDKRIFDSKYGPAFIESLPTVSMKIVDLPELCQCIEDV